MLLTGYMVNEHIIKIKLSFFLHENYMPELYVLKWTYTVPRRREESNLSDLSDLWLVS